MTAVQTYPRSLIYLLTCLAVAFAVGGWVFAVSFVLVVELATVIYAYETIRHRGRRR
jgi:hypothetical protein